MYMRQYTEELNALIIFIFVKYKLYLILRDSKNYLPKKKRRKSSNNLMLHLKELEK